MQKTIDTNIITGEKIIIWGSIKIEFTGDDITKEIAEAGIKAMEEHLLSYKNAVDYDSGN